MVRRRAFAAIACLAALAVAGVVLLRSGGDDGRPAHPSVRPAPEVPLPPPAPEVPLPPPAPEVPPAQPQPAPEATLPRGPVGARVVRRTLLRRAPGGPVVKAVGTTTGYGSERVLAVVARRGRWLGVLTDHMPNSRAAWIPADSAELVHEPYRIDVDLSARRVTVRRDGRVVRRIRVAIGAPGTPTPTGRFAVTDTLRISKANPEYGCCAVALTGRQPNLPPGWTLSDRLAIHGTPNEAGIGSEITNGCLHARRADMRWLLHKVTLGAQVRIRA